MVLLGVDLHSQRHPFPLFDGGNSNFYVSVVFFETSAGFAVGRPVGRAVQPF